MLALLGLMGLALAASAFVDFSSDGNADDAPTSDDAAEDITIVRVDDLMEVSNDAGAGQDAPDDVALPIDDLPGGQDPAPFLDVPGSTVIGTDGADLIYGGDGYDLLLGGDSDDVIHGGRGDDLIDGGWGDDDLFGHTGNDEVFGDQGDDYLDGGSGDDRLEGGDGDDTVMGGYGNDRLFGGAGADQMNGGWGDDTLYGGDDDLTDLLNGGAGADILYAGTGDNLNGGDGADTFALGQASAVHIDDFNAAEDVITVTYDGPLPALRTESDAEGTTLFADDVAVARLSGVSSLDLTHVQLLAA